jgi:DNA-binding transcriptional ArsR family regulator
MKRIHNLDDLSALRALTDPLRKAIIRELQREPKTASQLAAALGEKPTKLSYHVLELERNGLIELVETRMKGNLQEKYYRAVAEMFRVDPRLFAEGPEGEDAFYEHVTGLLDRAALDFREAIRSGQITPDESRRALASQLHLRLTPEQAAEFRDRLEALLAEFREKPSENTPIGAALTLLFCPLKPLTTGDIPPADAPDGVRRDT